MYENPRYKDHFEFIKSWFVKPLISHIINDQKRYRETVWEIFGGEYRSIDYYVAVENFKMPGTIHQDGGRQIQGLGYRYVYKGQDRILIRTDSREPKRIDIELPCGRGKEFLFFQLTWNDWLQIRRHLRKVPKLSDEKEITYKPKKKRDPWNEA